MTEIINTTKAGISVPPGLAGVAVTDTQIGDVRGDRGYYHYRGLDAIELARTMSFEEVWHLLVLGRLPDTREVESFRDRVAPLRILPAPVAEVLPAICAAAEDPLHVLRTALSLWGSTMRQRPMYDAPEGERLDGALAAVAVTPTILAAAHRLQRGLTPIEPDPGLGLAADYLRMVTGRVPQPHDARAIETYLVSTMDHGFNASTFTARVVASTGADLAGCVVAALGSFAGPRHGGAPGRALEALDEIGSADRAADYVRDHLLRGERIMGFGHAVYRTRDPRSEMLRDIAQGYDDPLVELAVEVEDVFERTLAELKPGRELHANVEFYAGVVMKVAGLEPAMFTPTFCVARMVGWTANILEQARDTKIIRPSARYVGPIPAQASL